MIKMNEDILNVISAVLDYKRFVISNNRINQKKNFDWFAETEKYYRSIPIPDGMEHNRGDFERILGYSTPVLDKLDNMGSDELQRETWKK